MVRILHMNGGDGETSYAKNSSIQNMIVSLTKDVRQRAVVDWYCSELPECVRIADLGCSSGPNTLLVASDVIEAVEERCRQLGRRTPEFVVFLNDLPGNDFNNLFSSLLPELHRRHGECFIVGVPGSFYGRVFPSRSLHFVHSSSSLHWLSQVPPELQDGAKVPLNRGKIYISKASLSCVLDAYLMQFQRDFTLFLKCRAEEIIVGGRMVLTWMGRRSSGPSARENYYLWELLAQSLTDMAAQGFVNKKKVDSFNVPYYAPSLEEVKHVIESEGSFDINHLDIFEASWDATRIHYINGKIIKDKGCTVGELSSAQLMARGLRAVLESMLASHFGQDNIEELFMRYNNLLEEYYSKNKAQVTNIVISLVRSP